MPQRRSIRVLENGCIAIAFFVSTGCELLSLTRTVRFSCNDWAYEAQIYGMNGIVIEHATLSYRNTVVPPVLVKNGFSFYTPIGRFSPLNNKLVPHATSPAWWTDKFSPPCEMSCRIDQSVHATNQVLALGFYRVDVIADQGFISEQAPLQKRETPTDWVCIQKESTGYWVDPAMIDLLTLPILNDFEEQTESDQKDQ